MTPTDKRTLRRAIRAEIAKLSPDERKALSTQIFGKIELLPEVAEASVVALFASLPDEPQTAEIIERLSRTKRVVLPRIEGEEMEFYDISEGLSKGAFGIMEPVAATPVSPAEIDVIVVPGVAFTREGMRCGRGKGFYDRYLSHNHFHAYTVGVSFPCQVVAELPCEEHDRRLDRVVTAQLY